MDLAKFYPVKHWLTTLSLLTVSVLFSLSFYEAGNLNDSVIAYGYSNNQAKAKLTDQYLASGSKVDTNKISERIIRLDDALRNFQNLIDIKQISELELLIDKIQVEGLSIVTIGDIRKYFQYLDFG